ncbi:hypothetical protein TNCV_3292061 [Trichonephila clavipes]|nr:hypothetical protein TNCV_3292061 [Trichonephila clavipes]
MFKQDNVRSHVASIVRTFLYSKNVRLFPWPAHSPDISPIKSVWSMFAERSACHHTLVTTVNVLWHRVDAALTSVSVHVIQFLFDSMPKRISSVINARVGCSGHCFLRIYKPKLLENLNTFYFQYNKYN